MKRLKELNRDQKVELLARVEAGEISLEDLTDNTMIEDNPADYFNSLLQRERDNLNGKKYPLILLGDNSSKVGKLPQVAREMAQGEKLYSPPAEG